MKPRYSDEYVQRTYHGESVFDLWQMLTTLEKHIPLPEKSWLFCRLVEWMSATRSGVWTYHEATASALQSQILVSIRRCPALSSVAEFYEVGMMTWNTEEKADRVDEWLDSHERQLHAELMELAREDQALVMELNVALKS